MLEASSITARDRTNGRHQQDVSVIRDARAAEMRVTEAVDYRVGIVIARTTVPTCESRVRTELDHAERHYRARESVTVTGGADEWVNVTCEILLREHLRVQSADYADYTDQLFHGAVAIA